MQKNLEQTKDALTLGTNKRLNGKADRLGTDVEPYSYNVVVVGNTVKEHFRISAHPTSHLHGSWGLTPEQGANVPHSLTMPKVLLRPWPAGFAWSAPRLNSFPSHVTFVLCWWLSLSCTQADQCLSCGGGDGGGGAEAVTWEMQERGKNHWNYIVVTVQQAACHYSFNTELNFKRHALLEKAQFITHALLPLKVFQKLTVSILNNSGVTGCTFLTVSTVLEVFLSVSKTYYKPPRISATTHSHNAFI